MPLESSAPYSAASGASLRAKIGFSLRQLRQRLRTLEFARRAAAFPFDGYPGGTAIPFVELLSAEQLTELNAILDWNSFVVDSRGRRFGAAAAHAKGATPQRFPNKRTRLMHDRFGLQDRTVLEVGCFEGAHTIGLCMLGARVTAIDSRVENVVKTIVRTAMFDYRPRVFVCDVERRPVPAALLAAEFCHHVGVLYHLQDPVSHVLELGTLISRGILLDTHYALDEDATLRYTVDGESFAYRRYGEFGYRDVLSGMYDHAKWLTLPSLLALLQRAGFTRVLDVTSRVGTQGPRALILAEKTS